MFSYYFSWYLKINECTIYMSKLALKDLFEVLLFN